MNDASIFLPNVVPHERVAHAFNRYYFPGKAALILEASKTPQVSWRDVDIFLPYKALMFHSYNICRTYRKSWVQKRNRVRSCYRHCRVLGIRQVSEQ